MANQVVQVVLRCESAAETEHLGNKSFLGIAYTIDHRMKTQFNWRLFEHENMI